MQDIVVPTLGESVTEATVGKWLKAQGDSVRKDEPLVELETDKVAVEVAAPENGMLQQIVAKVGETVSIGAVLGRLAQSAGAAAAASAPMPTVKAEAPSAAPAPVTAASAPAPVMANAALLDVRVPAMGESVAEGTLGRWLKKPGDAVRQDEPIAEIETDKVAVEVPAPAAGVFTEALVTEGQSVGIGAVIARINASGSAAAPPPAAAASAAPMTAAAPAAPNIAPPSVQRIAAEAGLNPAQIAGTGKDGRVTKADALAALAQPVPAPAPVASAKPAASGPREERVKMTRLRQTIARRLKESQNNAAMLTTFNEVDMSAVMALRTKYKDVFEKRHGVKVGFMSFFAKACVAALKDVPAVNAEIDGTDIVYKNHYDLGIAVGTDKGLVVPVVRDVDAMSFAQIEKEIGRLGLAARDGTLTLGDLQGATFTITNGGIYGSLMSTPILNPPGSGILGMHKIQDRPIAINGQIVIRPMMYLALSYDHRLVDGKEAVTFLVRVKEAIEDPERLLLDL